MPSGKHQTPHADPHFAERSHEGEMGHRPAGSYANQSHTDKDALQSGALPHPTDDRPCGTIACISPPSKDAAIIRGVIFLLMISRESFSAGIGSCELNRECRLRL